MNARNQRITKYFNAGNDKQAALNCNLKPEKQSVSKRKVEAVLKRDNGRCLVCGSDKKLEIDHIQSLENGGTNSVHNLATLCNKCRKIKTKHDKSLTRKRKSVCSK